jgi:hypothetical protein
VASDRHYLVFARAEFGKARRGGTTVRRLAESLAADSGKFANVRCFIGKVKYLTMNELLHFGNNVFANGLDAIPLAKTLLVKRLAFRHEREVRLLHFAGENHGGGDLYSYEVNPHKLIDQMMIDPRLSEGQARALKQDIQNQTAFAGSIKRSLLYAPPRKMVFPIGGHF